MGSFSDEMIFYLGLIIAGVAVFAGIVYTIVYCIGKKRLNDKFDAEYGKTYQKRH